VINRVPKAHFVVAGRASGVESQQFQNRLLQSIKNRGLEGRFHFLGFRSDIPSIMKSLDILVMPSWKEPFGRVVVEGQAAGCPVIGTNAGGIPEIIQDGVNGLLIPPKDPSSLAQAIIRLSLDATLRDRLGQAGLRSAQRFDVRQHVELIQKLYDAILSSKFDEGF